MLKETGSIRPTLQWSLRSTGDSHRSVFPSKFAGAVKGNHDHWDGLRAILQMMEADSRLGITPPRSGTGKSRRRQVLRREAESASQGSGPTSERPRRPCSAPADVGSRPLLVATSLPPRARTRAGLSVDMPMLDRTSAPLLRPDTAPLDALPTRLQSQSTTTPTGRSGVVPLTVAGRSSVLSLQALSADSTEAMALDAQGTHQEDTASTTCPEVATADLANAGAVTTSSPSALPESPTTPAAAADKAVDLEPLSPVKVPKPPSRGSKQDLRTFRRSVAPKTPHHHNDQQL